MRKILFISLAVFLSAYILGCKKQQPETTEMPEQMASMETMNLMAPELKPEPAPMVPAAEEKLQTLPPSGPYQPTPIQIQTALKNAGFYLGGIDGKIGPLTRKAIEDFQKANNLKVDGKVGPKTWAVLEKSLNAPEAKPIKKGKKR
jgi:murein L,D-transpeptidase YcbB/YkuD